MPSSFPSEHSGSDLSLEDSNQALAGSAGAADESDTNQMSPAEEDEYMTAQVTYEKTSAATEIDAASEAAAEAAPTSSILNSAVDSEEAIVPDGNGKSRRAKIAKLDHHSDDYSMSMQHHESKSLRRYQGEEEPIDSNTYVLFLSNPILNKFCLQVLKLKKMLNYDIKI